MDSTELEKHVHELLKKASDTHSCDDAMRFSQAALNAAKAISELRLLYK